MPDSRLCIPFSPGQLSVEDCAGNKDHVVCPEKKKNDVKLFNGRIFPNNQETYQNTSSKTKTFILSADPSSSGSPKAILSNKQYTYTFTLSGPPGSEESLVGVRMSSDDSKNLGDMRYDYGISYRGLPTAKKIFPNLQEMEYVNQKIYVSVQYIDNQQLIQLQYGSSRTLPSIPLSSTGSYYFAVTLTPGAMVSVSSKKK
jgi:hypothetical protein